MIIPFVKMHGIGNDFIVFDDISTGARPTDSTGAALSVETLAALAPELCDRRFGIGADGLIFVLPPETDGVDFLYRHFNPDGSEAEMCGNGIRCFGKRVYELGLTDRREISVEIAGTIKRLKLDVGASNTVDSVTVDMGEPILSRADIPMVVPESGDPSATVLAETLTVLGETISITAVSMGNPHAVFFVESDGDETIDRLGPSIEVHAAFPRKTNVHAVQVLAENEVRMWTWERGTGRTLACGTGACAVAVACALRGFTGRDVLCHLPGGDLRIQWTEENRVLMTGSAQNVFTGVASL